MKATKQIKTPSLTIYLTPGEKRRDPLEEADRARLLANRMQYTRLRDLVKDTPRVFSDPLPGTSVERDRLFVEQSYSTEPPADRAAGRLGDPTRVESRSHGGARVLGDPTSNVSATIIYLDRAAVCIYRIERR